MTNQPSQPMEELEKQIEHILSMVWNDGASLAGGAYLNSGHYGLVEAIPKVMQLFTEYAKKGKI